MRGPLVIPIFSFLAGIFLIDLAAGFIHLRYTAAYVPFFILIMILVIILLSGKRSFFPLVCLFFFVLGIFRYSSYAVPAENDISNFIHREPQKILVYGTVISRPRKHRSLYSFRCFSFILRSERLLSAESEKPVSGKISVKLFTSIRRPCIGDKLVISGEAYLPRKGKNTSGFNYSRYLKREGIYAVMCSSDRDHYLKTGTAKGLFIHIKRLLFSAGNAAERTILRHLSRTAGGILKSVILGMRDGITAETNELFIKTGTMHILAVSGLHIGIVSIIIMGGSGLVRLPRNLIYLFTAFGICAFTVFAGCRPSSVRAALMGVFLLLGLFTGKDRNIKNALLFSAFFMVFFKPGQLFDPGFILSYSAVLAIIYITPITDVFFKVPSCGCTENRITAVKKYLLKSLSVSSAIWIGMMPIIAVYFNIITPVTVLLNILAIPLLVFLFIVGFCLLLTSPFDGLSLLSGFTAGALDLATIVFIKFLKAALRIPFAYIRVSSPPVLAIVIFYIAAGGISVYLWRNKRTKMIIAAVLLCLANLFVWNELGSSTQPDSLRATFFNVGKADASLLEFSDGSVMLVDGGSGGKCADNDDGRSILAPYFWRKGIRKIDCVVLTHAHYDHIGGLLYILQNFNVGSVIDSVSTDDIEIDERILYDKFREMIKCRNIRCVRVGRGDVIKGFADSDIVVLNPPGRQKYGDPNNDSIVMKVSGEKGKSILLCADIESDAIKDILCFGGLLRSDMMKIPHHGMGLGDKFIVEKFLQEVSCQDAVITNKDKDRLNKGLMSMLAGQHAGIYITGEHSGIIARESEDGFQISDF